MKQIAQLLITGLICNLTSLFFSYYATAQAQTVLIFEQDRKIDTAYKFNQDILDLIDQGKYTEAISLVEKSINIKRKIEHKSTLELAAALNFLAQLYQTQRNYPKAKLLFQEAIDITTEMSPMYQAQKAIYINNLAYLYFVQGLYPEAEKLYNKSLEAARASLPKQHPDLVKYLKNIALLYRMLGHLTRAEGLYNEALEIATISLDSNHPYIAEIRNELAKIYLFRGSILEAEISSEKALEIIKRALPIQNSTHADILQNLAEIYLSQGRTLEAEKVSKEALNIIENSLPINNSLQANILENMAKIYHIQGHTLNAEKFYQEATDIASTRLSDKHPSLAKYLINLAKINLENNDLSSARANLQLGLEIEERNLSRNLVLGNEKQKKLFLSKYINTTNFAISFHQQYNNSDKTSAHVAFNTILRRKGRILDILGQSFRKYHESNNSEVKEQLLLLQKTHDMLSTLVTSQNFYSYNNYFKNLQKIYAHELHIISNLRRLNSDIDEIFKPLQIELIRKNIPDKSILIEFIKYSPFTPNSYSNTNNIRKLYSPSEYLNMLLSRGLYENELLNNLTLNYNSITKSKKSDRYAVYTLSKSGDISWMDLGNVDEIKLLINDYIEHIQSPFTSRDQLEQSAIPLYKKIFFPIQDIIGDAEHLLISPDGDLNLIPFEALLDKNGRYLIEGFQFTYLSSGRDMLKLNAPLLKSESSLLLAGPNFDSKNIEITNSMKQKYLLQNNIKELKQYSPDFKRLLPFQELPGTIDESEAIKDLFDFQVYTNQNATETIIKQRPNPKLLHLATHGFFLEENENKSYISADTYKSLFEKRMNEFLREQPLLRSGLVFAGVNNMKQNQYWDNGVLTAKEVSGLNLSATKMVVMSACKSGLGDIKSGEGVYGLRRAFTLAGARSQVMSLWNVQDDSTKEFMVAFYKNLKKGESRGAALRNVKLKMLNGEFNNKTTSRNFSTPYYWAPFIRTGDWRPL